MGLSTEKAIRAAVVGGGGGGVEMTLSGGARF
jgi:hypothetical protein